jgi:hypothetical protein
MMIFRPLARCRRRSHIRCADTHGRRGASGRGAGAARLTDLVDGFLMGYRVLI